MFLINPWEKQISELLQRFGHDATGREVLSKAAALAGNNARNNIQQKDYHARLTLARAGDTDSKTIVSDQGWFLFVTGVLCLYDSDMSFPPLVSIRDATREKNWFGGPRSQAGYPMALRNYIEANFAGPGAGNVAQGANVYPVWSEPKEAAYYAGERCVFELSAAASPVSLPGSVDIILTGYQFNLSGLRNVNPL
jgi:hypothetical protein